MLNAYTCIIVCKYGSFFVEKQFCRLFCDCFRVNSNNYEGVCDNF